jgi:hypothetical protein
MDLKVCNRAKVRNPPIVAKSASGPLQTSAIIPSPIPQNSNADIRILKRLLTASWQVSKTTFLEPWTTISLPSAAQALSGGETLSLAVLSN